ncbi:hypothetical protein IWX78_002305 [Mycetocola sp. CAN_C7]|uniref:hypothetical protein n=1 Tax=Mycetocola sp. CAN_C7 TaxID=2787724 RepID=UPI0018C9A42C
MEGDLALQAAFGAAVVYGPWHLSESTVQRGEIFDHPARSDREMQLKILYRTLRDQANTAVVAASRGDVTDEIRGYIAHHSGVALGDRDLILSQVDGLPVGLDGRDPRSDPQDA